MSYTKQTWTTGEVITEEKLNHMEEGIEDAGGGSSGGLVRITIGTSTWEELLSQFEDQLYFNATSTSNVIVLSPDRTKQGYLVSTGEDYDFYFHFLTASGTYGKLALYILTFPYGGDRTAVISDSDVEIIEIG